MENEHIVGKFDDELNRIKSEILEIILANTFGIFLNLPGQSFLL